MILYMYKMVKKYKNLLFIKINAKLCINSSKNCYETYLSIKIKLFIGNNSKMTFIR